jgi:uncharacterized SAM-binding protein YcdF (DUF218 family)
MAAIAEIVKVAFIPGSLSFLLIALGLGTICLFGGRKLRRTGRGLLTATLLLYLLLGMPAVVRALEAPLAAGYGPLDQASAATTQIKAIVILGGGSNSYHSDGRTIDVLSDASALRVLEGARLYYSLNDPWVIVSGGSLAEDPDTTPESYPMRRELVRLGVPAARIRIEAESSDTHQQAVRLAQLMASGDFQPFVMVTSETHVRRAVGAMAGVGLHPQVSAAEQRDMPLPTGWKSLLPSLDALDSSRVALREYLGLVYYAVRGWLA